MESLKSDTISKLIYESLDARKEALTSAYRTSKPHIGYFYIDDLLPEALALKCFEVFPDPSDMRCLKTLREFKHVSAQMDKLNPMLEEVIYAFQKPNIVKLIGEICNIDS